MGQANWRKKNDPTYGQSRTVVVTCAGLKGQKATYTYTAQQMNEAVRNNVKAMVEMAKHHPDKVVEMAEVMKTNGPRGTLLYTLASGFGKAIRENEGPEMFDIICSCICGYGASLGLQKMSIDTSPNTPYTIMVYGVYDNNIHFNAEYNYIKQEGTIQRVDPTKTH